MRRAYGWRGAVAEADRIRVTRRVRCAVLTCRDVMMIRQMFLIGKGGRHGSGPTAACPGFKRERLGRGDTGPTRRAKAAQHLHRPGPPSGPAEALAGVRESHPGRLDPTRTRTRTLHPPDGLSVPV